MSLDATNYGTLTAMISPALFLTATGSLIISTSNRMSRIVDRIRTITELSDDIDRGDTHLDFPEHRRQHCFRQLEWLVWRSDRVRSALTMLYAALTAFVGTSLGLAVDVLLGHLVEAVPTMLAVTGVVLLMAASMQLVREARQALRGNKIEVEFYRELHDWRLRGPAAAAAITPPRNHISRVRGADQRLGPTTILQSQTDPPTQLRSQR